MIRKAEKKDLPYLLELGEMFFKESKYESELGVTFNPKDALQWLLSLMNREEIGFWVSENPKVNGFLIGILDPLFFNFKEKMAMELLWYVEPSSRKRKISRELMKEFEEWARMNGAKFIEIGSVKTIEMEKTSKLFERIGYPKFRNGHLKKLEVN